MSDDEIIELCTPARMQGDVGLKIGDLVISNKRVCFLGYAIHMGSGGLKTALAGAGGGAGMVVSTLLTSGDEERRERQQANAKASKTRSNQYGLSLCERLCRCRGSHQWDRDSSLSLAFDEEQLLLILEHSQSGQAVIAVVGRDKAKAAYLGQYPAATGIYDGSADPLGFYLGDASPDSVVDALVAKKAVDTERVISRADDAKWINAFCTALARNRRAWDNLQDLPECVRTATAKDTRNRRKEQLVSTLKGLGLVLSGILTHLYLPFRANDGSPELFTVAISGFLLVCGVIVLGQGIVKSARLNSLTRRLTGP